MLYILYRLSYLLVKVLPLKCTYFFAEQIANIYYHFSRGDRKALKDNLSVVLGEEATEEEIEREVLAVFTNFAKYLGDFLRFSKYTPQFIARNFKILGKENLDKCFAWGKGVIVLSLHLGNWELGGAIVGGMNYPISAIVLEHPGKKVNDFFVRQRAINNVRSIPVGIQIKECFRALKRNEVVAIIGDKDYTANGIEIDFFGKKAVLPKGPAVISIKSGAPIVCCFIVRNADNSCDMIFEEPITAQKSGDIEGDIRALMGKYVKIFEKYIREYPGQWYVFNKIWAQ